MFRNPDVIDYAVCARKSDQAYYLLRDRDWAQELCGPYSESEILRAFRLADDVDESDEYTPDYWFENQDPIRISPELLSQDYSRVDISHLPTSVTHYTWTEDEQVKRHSRLAYCQSKAPDIGFPPNPCVHTSHLVGDVEINLSGYLTKEWNCHPVGSLFVTSTRIEDDLILVLDFPISTLCAALRPSEQFTPIEDLGSV